jgi:hypothetical protein
VALGPNVAQHMETSNCAAIFKKGLETYRSRGATMLSLAVGWWAVLLVPEASRGFLLEGTKLDMLWGFVRVVALVTGASVVFQRMPRRSSWQTCASAFGCLWGGSAVFALTSMPPFDAASLLACLLSAPLLFIMFAWYAVFPMTILTAVVLSSLYTSAGTQ